jgi:hypothetical protein
MSNMADDFNTEPLEAQIDRVLDELSAKIMDGTASAEDKANYRQMVARRTDLMRPLKIDVGRWLERKRSAA